MAAVLALVAACSNLWPLVPLRLSSVLALLMAAMVTRTTLRTPRLAWPYLIGIGALDDLANVAYLASGFLVR